MALERLFASGLSDPKSAQYKHRREVLDLLDKLKSYGYSWVLFKTIASTYFVK